MPRCALCLVQEATTTVAWPPHSGERFAKPAPVFQAPACNRCVGEHEEREMTRRRIVRTKHLERTP